MYIDPGVAHGLLSHRAPSAVMIVIGYPLARALGGRLDGGAARLELPGRSELGAHLERIEPAVGAIAVEAERNSEVERISEAQRFQARLRAGPDVDPPRSGGAGAEPRR